MQYIVQCTYYVIWTAKYICASVSVVFLFVSLSFCLTNIISISRLYWLQFGTCPLHIRYTSMLSLPSSSFCSLSLATSCLFRRRLSFFRSLLNCLWLKHSKKAGMNALKDLECNLHNRNREELYKLQLPSINNIKKSRQNSHKLQNTL